MREICDKMKTKNCLLKWRSSWQSPLIVIWLFLCCKVSVLVLLIQTLEINEFMQKIILEGSGLVWLVFILLAHTLQCQTRIKLQDLTRELSNVFVFISIPYHFLGAIVTTWNAEPTLSPR